MFGIRSTFYSNVLLQHWGFQALAAVVTQRMDSESLVLARSHPSIHHVQWKPSRTSHLPNTNEVLGIFCINPNSSYQVRVNLEWRRKCTTFLCFSQIVLHVSRVLVLWKLVSTGTFPSPANVQQKSAECCRLGRVCHYGVSYVSRPCNVAVPLGTIMLWLHPQTVILEVLFNSNLKRPPFWKIVFEEHALSIKCSPTLLFHMD